MNNAVDNPYETPDASGGIDNAQDYKPRIFSTKGRIGRLRYLAYSMIYNIIILFLIGIASAILIPAASSASPEGASALITIIVAIMYIPLIVTFFIVARRRLNDLNQSGWLSLIMIVPLLNVFFGLYLLFWPGTNGTNEYGPAPQANTALEIIVGLIAPIFIVGVLAAIAIPAYQDYVERAQQAQTQAP